MAGETKSNRGGAVNRWWIWVLGLSILVPSALCGTYLLITALGGLVSTRDERTLTEITVAPVATGSISNEGEPTTVDEFVDAFIAPTETLVPTAPTATLTPLPTATSTPLPTITLTPLPTATSTPLPTATPTSLPTVTPTSLPIIIDFLTVLGSSVDNVEAYFGESGEALPIEVGEFPQELPGGGESREYGPIFDDLYVLVFYDTMKVAKLMIVVAGLTTYGYNLDEWSALMPRLGFPITSPPDRIAEAGLLWEDFNGYGIAINTVLIGGPIGYVKIFILPQS